MTHITSPFPSATAHTLATFLLTSCVFLSGQALSEGSPSGTTLSTTDQENTRTLLSDELKDAEKREQQELEDRVRALKKQLEDSNRLLETQERYIRLLEQELNNLQQGSSAHSVEP